MTSVPAAIPAPVPGSALPDAGTRPAPGAFIRPGRLLSMDLLRGLTIGFMILVNDNADDLHAYWPLKHADWNGFTPTDLVFPTFLFLVGVSTVLSISKRLSQGASRLHLFSHVIRRSIIIFLLGMLVNTFPLFHLETIRIYGVLPRIAVCYLIVASLYLLSPGWRSKAGLLVAALAGYWILLRFVPVPGYGVPTHTVPLLDKDGNLAAWLDRQVFSAPHLYERTRDPEGLLSTLPAVGTALIGVLAGIWFKTAHSIRRKATGITVAGLSCVLLGSLWNLSFPINKKMWTSSYTLFAAGLSMLLLAAFVWLVDVRGERAQASAAGKPSALATPLLVFGTNAIAAYVISELLAAGLPHIHLHGGDPGALYYRFILQLVPHNPAFSSLLFSLSFVAVCWIPVYVLYRNRIFIRI